MISQNYQKYITPVVFAIITALVLYFVLKISTVLIVIVAAAVGVMVFLGMEKRAAAIGLSSGSPVIGSAAYKWGTSHGNGIYYNNSNYPNHYYVSQGNGMQIQIKVDENAGIPVPFLTPLSWGIETLNPRQSVAVDSSSNLTGQTIASSPPSNVKVQLIDATNPSNTGNLMENSPFYIQMIDTNGNFVNVNVANNILTIQSGASQAFVLS